MFIIKRLEEHSIPECQSLFSGISFCHLNKPLFFNITLSNVVAPAFAFQFIVLRDSEKNNLSIEITNENKNSSTMKYFNPASGSSGNTNPITICGLNNKYVHLLFTVDTLNDCNYFKISYEFFEGNQIFYAGQPQ